MKKNNILLWIMIFFVISFFIFCILLVIKSNSNSNKKEIETPTEEVYFDAYLRLIGDEIIYLEYGEIYLEPGYIAYDNKGNDILENVIIKGEVNTLKSGTYILEYQVVSDGNILKETRKIIVQEKEEPVVTFDFSNEYTKGHVSINIKVEANNYNYILLPDGTKNSNKDIIYKITTNGEYQFEIFDDKGSIFLKKILINNIDNDPPIASCRINESNQVIVNAQDEGVGEITYQYWLNDNNYSNETNNNTYTYSNSINSTKVIVSDKLKNKIIIACTKVLSSYNPIAPTSSDLENAKIIKQDSKDTMKFWTIKTNNYYMTRIWLKDPYKQVKKYYATDIKSSLTTTNTVTLFDNLNKITQSKIVVGVNSDNSGCKGCIDIRHGIFISMNPNLVHPYRSHTSIINKDGYIEVFDDRRTSGSGRSTPKELVDKVKKERERIINSSPMLTINPSRLIINNGEVVKVSSDGYSKEKAKRTILCQVNRNNYIVFSSPISKYTVMEAAELLVEKGCNLAINLDGGGSTSFYVKTSTDNKFNAYIKGDSTRKYMIDVLYFTE